MAKFVKGVSGNPKGRPKTRNFDDVLRSLMLKSHGAQAKLLAESLIKQGIGGNVPALRLIAERCGGRVVAAEKPEAPPVETLTLEQVQRRLAELFARDDVRQMVQAVIMPDGKVQ